MAAWGWFLVADARVDVEVSEDAKTAGAFIVRLTLTTAHGEQRVARFPAPNPDAVHEIVEACKAACNAGLDVVEALVGR